MNEVYAMDPDETLMKLYHSPPHRIAARAHIFAEKGLAIP